MRQSEICKCNFLQSVCIISGHFLMFKKNDEYRLTLLNRKKNVFKVDVELIISIIKLL